MKNIYAFTIILLSGFSISAQIINIPDPNFKAKLLESSPLTGIAYASGSVPIAIDTNGNGEIELSETTSVAILNVSDAGITSLEGIEGFTQLNYLICKNNNLQSLDLSGTPSLTTVNCSNNQLNSVNFGSLPDLWNIDCSYNQLASLNLSALPFLNSLNCSNNQLSVLNPSMLNNTMTVIDCSHNLLTALDLNAITTLKELRCNHNQLTSLNVSEISNTFAHLDCSYNMLTSLAVPNFFQFEDMGPQDMGLICDHNQLSQITFNLEDGSEDFAPLDLSSNNFTELDLSHLRIYGTAKISDNPLTNVIFEDFYMNDPGSPGSHVDLIIENTALVTLDLYDTDNLWLSNNPNLVSLNLHNGRSNFYNETYYDENGDEYYVPQGLVLENNPMLAFVCCDAYEVDYLASLLPGATATEYCSFGPIGGYNTITGSVSLNCPGNDMATGAIHVSVNAIGSFLNNGNTFTTYTGAGNQYVAVQMAHPEYFSVTPANYVFSFNSFGNTETANFCLTPNGNHSDLEVTILPLTAARPGFDCRYQITITNNGTQVESGTAILNFNDTILDFISSDVLPTLQNSGNISWDFDNLLPFETRSFMCTLNLNSPAEIPPANINDELAFNASVSGSADDDTPGDNSAAYNQTVVGSFDPNDKVVVEGPFISIDDIGNFLHYIIRFQNTGNAPAENVVVKDIFAYTLIPRTAEVIAASHPYWTRMNGYDLEVIFEGINLPPSSVDEAGSHGCVAVKIRPTATLTAGYVLENKAKIYFDYNLPIITNTVSTTISQLSADSFGHAENFFIYPNPAGNFLHIDIADKSTLNSVHIYNGLGQLIRSFTKEESALPLSLQHLEAGAYFVEITSNAGRETRKLIKI